MSGCNCCDQQSPWVSIGLNVEYPPILESRSAEATRGRCAFLINGEWRTKKEQDVFCIRAGNFNPPIPEYVYVEEAVKTDQYFEVNPEGPICDIIETNIPPFVPHPPPHQGEGPVGWFPGCLFPIDARYKNLRGAGDTVTDDDHKEAVLKILDKTPYNEWGLGQPYAFYYDSFGAKSEYRIVHRPSPSCYLKAWIAEITFSENYGDPPSYTIHSEAIKIYTWDPITPPNEPCLTHPLKSVYDDEQIIRSQSFDLNPADGTDKFTLVYVKKYSFLKDYEPEDPLPFDPSTLSAERPDPDILPNGIPAPRFPFVPPS